MHGVFDALKDVLRVGYDASKTKTALRLALGRLKLLRNKRESARRAIETEVGEMLKQSRGFGYDAARIRCETVCREDATLKGYEILELTLETLLARLGDAAGRPLLAGLDEERRAARLRALLAEREADYASATFVVDADEGSPEHVAERVARLLDRETP